MEKREIRVQVRHRIASLSEEQREQASHLIFEQVASLPDFVGARVVALFSSLPDEPCSQQFLQEWHGRKRIVLPRVEGDVMNFYDYSPKQMQSGAFGIDEPQGDTPCPPEDIELMVVPGVAFTLDGKRMGRGKGFYDKYLSQSGFRATTVGVCFAVQMVDALPDEPHDQRVDIVVNG